MQYHHLIHFSLGEAQAILPRVVSSLERMRDLKKKLDEMGYDLRGHGYFRRMGTNGTGPYPPQVDELVEVHHEISSQGIQIKDIDRGLVDFPTIRPNGEEVYLCFMLGEENIGFWHRIEEGFPGRQSLDTL